MKRTPGKWEMLGIIDGIEKEAVIAIDGVPSLYIGRSAEYREKQAHEVATHIVRAVNCHERLVELVKRLMRAAFNQATLPGLDEVNALLAEAKGGEDE